MIAAGARGYIEKAADIHEVVKAIEALHHGRTYLSPEAAQAMADAVRGTGEGRPPKRRYAARA